MNSDGTSSDPTRTEGNDGPGQRHTDDGVATDRQWTIASVGLVGMVHTQFSFNMLADAQVSSVARHAVELISLGRLEASAELRPL